MYDVAGVTILLSQTVFSLLVAHVLTRTSEAVPLIGTDPPFLPTYPDEAKFDAMGSFLVFNVRTIMEERQIFSILFHIFIQFY